MRSLTAWRTVQGLYWLALGAWFGALVMLAIAAAATFATVWDYQPMLPAQPGAPPETSARAVPMLAGAIIGRCLDNLRWLQWICAVVAIVCLALQNTVFASRRPAGGCGQWINTLRIVLVLVPVVILVVDTAVINPKMKHDRQIMHDLTQPAPQIELARQSFDSYHELSRRLFKVQVVMLGCAVLASAFVLHGNRADAPAPPDA